jgi:hypothetical protein
MKHPSLVLLAASFLAAPLSLAGLKITESDGTVEIHDGDRLVTALRTDYRFPYLYPLGSPSGANIARRWPMETNAPSEEKDHPHHRGLWIAHGNVNGYDFWNASKVEGTDIRINSVKTIVAEGESVSFSTDLTWIANGEELLKETRSHTLSKPDGKTLRIDVTSTLQAIPDEVLFGDSKEGTFAIRTDRTLRVKGPEAKAALTNSEGHTDTDAWGKRAKWAAYSGPDELGEPVVVAIINNPASFRHPTHWHARDYGLLAANPFGIHDFERGQKKGAGDHALKKGETLTLVHAVVIHPGTLESARLDELHASLPVSN